LRGKKCFTTRLGEFEVATKNKRIEEITVTVDAFIVMSFQSLPFDWTQTTTSTKLDHVLLVEYDFHIKSHIKWKQYLLKIAVREINV